MHGSSAPARILTILFALVMTPVATGLLGAGGSLWNRALQIGGLQAGLPELIGLLGAVEVGTMVGLAALGAVLLAAVVATGAASSAGLLAVGVLGLASLLCAMVPGVLMTMYLPLSRLVPMSVVDGLLYGLPLLLHLLMGSLGVALAIARRQPRPPLPLAAAGLLASPLLLLAGALLLCESLARGQMMVLLRFDTAFHPLAAVLALLGAAALVLGGAAAGWSTAALLLPAAVLGALTIALVGVPSILVGLISPLWQFPVARTAHAVLVMGGGIGGTVVLVVGMIVLARVRGRARRRAATIRVAPGVEIGPQPA